MELISGIGWAAAFFFPSITPAGEWVAENTDTINAKFVERVDLGYSCWTRVGGDIGVYGHPGNYSLDPVCYIAGKKDLPDVSLDTTSDTTSIDLGTDVVMRVATPYVTPLESKEACEG